MSDTHFPIRLACSEEMERLCAMFTASALNHDELATLEEHLPDCRLCRSALAGYTSLASDGIAKLAAEHHLQEESLNAEATWQDESAQAHAKNLLLQNLAVAASTLAKSAGPRILEGNFLRPVPLRPNTGLFSRGNLPELLPIAAVLVLGLTLGYAVGTKRSSSSTASRVNIPDAHVSVPAQSQSLLSQRDALSAQLATTSQNIDLLKSRLETQESALSQVSTLKVSLQQQLRALDTDDRQKTDSLNALAVQRDDLQRSLGEADQSVHNLQVDLKKLQDERQKALLRTASLETKIDDLSAELREAKPDFAASARRQDDSMASDRDIREMIGARQLYIADVFDVDQNGQKRKPFGRVFYTKGKSLIFYAL